ncbi:hypothetical protein DFJ73DRAFT_871670 [Zopfochytrium polystomum]|nr:hypothetical protein DFJ73DRAFT_871670 [Zopfochytrium polystomum]
MPLPWTSTPPIAPTLSLPPLSSPPSSLLAPAAPAASAVDANVHQAPWASGVIIGNFAAEDNCVAAFKFMDPFISSSWHPREEDFLLLVSHSIDTLLACSNPSSGAADPRTKRDSCIQASATRAAKGTRRRASTLPSPTISLEPDREITEKEKLALLSALVGTWTIVLKLNKNLRWRRSILKLWAAPCKTIGGRRGDNGGWRHGDNTSDSSSSFGARSFWNDFVGLCGLLRAGQCQKVTDLVEELLMLMLSEVQFDLECSSNVFETFLVQNMEHRNLSAFLRDPENGILEVILSANRSELTLIREALIGLFIQLCSLASIEGQSRINLRTFADEVYSQLLCHPLVERLETILSISQTIKSIPLQLALIQAELQSSSTWTRPSSARSSSDDYYSSSLSMRKVISSYFSISPARIPNRAVSQEKSIRSVKRQALIRSRERSLSPPSSSCFFIDLTDGAAEERETPTRKATADSDISESDSMDDSVPTAAVDDWLASCSALSSLLYCLLEGYLQLNPIGGLPPAEQRELERLEQAIVKKGEAADKENC